MSISCHVHRWQVNIDSRSNFKIPILVATVCFSHFVILCINVYIYNAVRFDTKHVALHVFMLIHILK
jgi:hypothetical protein